MKIKNYLFLGMIAVLAVTACKKSSIQKSIVAGTKIDTDVYVAGNLYNYKTNKSIAAYWKNGKPHALSDGTTRCYATGVAVHGTDVFVCGYDQDSKTAVYWKNGTRTTLASGPNQNFAEANVIKLSDDGAIVHIAGVIYDGASHIPVYWRSDEPTTAHILPIKRNTLPAAHPAYANTIALNGPDVYIGGTNADSAVYWKNGDYINVWDSGLDAINGIAFKGTELYMAGYTTASAIDAAVTWQGASIKRTPLLLGSNLSPSRALAVAANSTDVYIGGYTTNAAGLKVASYWKNGQIQPSVDLGPDVGGDSGIYDITVAGNTVYACGYYGGGFSVYWKNGVAIPLAESNGVYAIAVVTYPHVN